MFNIIFYTKRSMAIILLISGSFTALSARVLEENSLISNSKSIAVHQELSDILVKKGLEASVANEKVNHFLANRPSTTFILDALKRSEVLNLSETKFNEALAKQALLGNHIDFSSYKSLASLVQTTKAVPLTLTQIKELQTIAALS